MYCTVIIHRMPPWSHVWSFLCSFVKVCTVLGESMPFSPQKMHMTSLHATMRKLGVPHFFSFFPFFLFQKTICPVTTFMRLVWTLRPLRLGVTFGRFEKIDPDQWRNHHTDQCPACDGTYFLVFLSLGLPYIILLVERGQEFVRLYDCHLENRANPVDVLVLC